MALSLCMIVKDEAHTLPRCLESVAGLVDEIIVVDTGSSDETVAIAQSYSAVVDYTPWTGDFAAARNVSLQRATGDWILVLDADEVWAADSTAAVQQAMQDETTLVINLLRQEVGAAQSPYSMVSRLFRRHPGLRFSRPYHAMIDDDAIALIQQNPQWRVVELPQVAILHYGYQAEAIASRNKLQTAQATLEASLAEHPEDPYEYSKLGALYVHQGLVEPGLALLQQGLALAEQANSAAAPVLYELHYHLGIAHARLQQLAPAVAHYQAAIGQPLLPVLKLGAYNNLASLLKSAGDLAGARQLYETCLQIDPEFAIGHYNLGATLRSQGQLKEAVYHYQQAIRFNPAHAEAHQNLGVALMKLGQVEESLASFGRAIALHSQHSPEQAERLRQGLKEMGFQL